MSVSPLDFCSIAEQVTTFQNHCPFSFGELQSAFILIPYGMNTSMILAGPFVYIPRKRLEDMVLMVFVYFQYQWIPQSSPFCKCIRLG